MIKPGYILSLPPEEQIKMAQCISAGRQDLCITLQKLWGRGIMTEACSTKHIHDKPMICLSVGFDDEENQELVQQLYEQDDIVCDTYCIELNRFEVQLSGENLYRYLGQDRIPVAKNKKPNIFESAAEEGVKYFQDMYDSHVACDVDATEDKACIDALKKFLKKCKDKMKPWDLAPDVKKAVVAKMTEVASSSTVDSLQVMSREIGEN